MGPTGLNQTSLCVGASSFRNCLLLEEAGLDAAAILARASDPEIKGALRENTERAQAEGICGVPTCVLTYEDGSTLRLWGQDRLVMVRAALRGWVPATAMAL